MSLKSLSFAEFSLALWQFRQDWSTEAFWMNPLDRQTRIDKLLTDFGVMDGTVDQVDTAGIGLRATILEYKMRLCLMVKGGQARV